MDVNAQNDRKSASLCLALMCGHAELARMFVKHGASMGGHMEFARELVECGADFNARHYLEITRFEEASRRRISDIDDAATLSA